MGIYPSVNQVEVHVIELSTKGINSRGMKRIEYFHFMGKPDGFKNLTGLHFFQTKFTWDCPQSIKKLGR